MASTSQCSVRYFARWSRDPVTIITTPPGIEVRRVEYVWRRREKEVGREKEEEEEEEKVNDD